MPDPFATDVLDWLDGLKTAQQEENCTRCTNFLCIETELALERSIKRALETWV